VPALVTGGETALGRVTALALARGGGEVRVFLDDGIAGADAEAVRRAGCKVSIGEIDDEGRLELALEQVHTVVHCWGGPLTAPDDEVDGAAGVLSAALGAGCRRFVWASHLGADDAAGATYLTACLEVEALIADAPLDSIVFRRGFTYGPGDALTDRLRAGACEGVRPGARHSPLALADLAAAFVQADALDRGRTEHSLVVELAGPDVVEFGALVTALGGPAGGRWSGEPLPPWTVELYSRDLVPGAGALGAGGTPLAVGAAEVAAAR